MFDHKVDRLEPLEPRQLLAAAPILISTALDLPAGVDVTTTGDTKATARASLNKVGGLLNFPTGRDTDFLLMSTGEAKLITGANTSGSQGTDLGDPGVAGDTTTIRITMPVPESPLPQRFRFDFMFLSEEYPEFVGSSFNDFFTATVNGQNIALDQNGNEVSVNNVFFDGSLSTQGTIFDGRTEALTATYRIPAGVDELDIVLRIGDAGDGIYDSAAFVDNFRITPQQLVYLNFDGANVGDTFFSDTTTVIEAFKTSDVGSTATREQIINVLLQSVQDEYAPYDISFTTTRPTAGPYTEVVIGGGKASRITIDPSWRGIFDNWARERNLPVLSLPTVPIEYFQFVLSGSFDVIGKAAGVDIGNRNLEGRALVFASEIATGTTDLVRLREVAEIIAHEVGHSVGLTHVEDENSLVFFQGIDDKDQSFLNKLTPRRAQEVSDEQKDAGFTQQNDHQYLLAVLGSSDPSSSGSLAAAFSGEASSAKPSFAFALAQNKPVYNPVFATYNPDVDVAPQFQGVPFINGEAIVQLSTFGEGTQLFAFASSTPGGPRDLVFGGFDGDDFTTTMDLFAGSGDLNMAFEIGQVNGDQVVPYATGTIEESDIIGGPIDAAGNTVAAALNLGANGKLVPLAGVIEHIGDGDAADFYKLVLKAKGAAKTIINLTSLIAPVKLAIGARKGNKFVVNKQVNSSGATARLKINTTGGKQILYVRVTPANASDGTDYLLNIIHKARRRARVA